MGELIDLVDLFILNDFRSQQNENDKIGFFDRFFVIANS